ncbi:hypothetical protein FACS189419_06360 [Planctomycetales bacterium]|nr:hypothetical protein FACS189419_06360 [Planctomycetales bacterium]
MCLVSAGLCSFAGMLPDIDSDTSRSFQECIYLAAGIGTVLLVERLKNYNLDPDLVVLAGAGMFLFIRFGIGKLIKRITAHRGMIHSIPMALLCGEIVFLLATGTLEERLLKAGALMAGFLSHLILDEVFSLDSTGQIFKPFRLKKSFGTALKWSDPKRKLATLLIYLAVGSFGYLSTGGNLNLNLMENEIGERESGNGTAVNGVPVNEVPLPSVEADYSFQQAAANPQPVRIKPVPVPDSEVNLFSPPPENYMPPLPSEMPPSIPVGNDFGIAPHEAVPAPITLR